MSKLKLLIFLVLVASVLAWTSFLVEAQAEDTYNFYFQKAPGPVTVNQGSSIEKAPGNLPSPIPSPANSPIVTSTVAEAANPSTSSRRWQLAFGYSHDWVDESDPAQFLTNKSPVGIIHGQAALNLQIDLTDLFAIEGAGYYITKPQVLFLGGRKTTATGRRYDWSAGAVVTPLRISSSSLPSGMSISGLVGAVSVPLLSFKNAHDPEHPMTTDEPSIRHSTRLYFGTRAAFGLTKTLAIVADIKRVPSFKMTKGTASFSYTF